MTAEIQVGNLAHHESVIARGLGTFVEVGQSLAAIHDQGLYRHTHETFEAYCDQRWNLSRRRAYDLMGAAESTKALCAIAHTPIPTNEGQARELRGLQPDVAADVMREAHQATNGKPTAADIRNARAHVTKPPAAHDSTPESSDQSPPVADSPAVQTPPEGITAEQYQRVQDALSEHVDDTDYVLASWRKHFGSAVGKATSVLTFPVEQVAAKADASLLSELERAHKDLGNYLSRVKKATRLRPVGGRK